MAVSSSRRKAKSKTRASHKRSEIVEDSVASKVTNRTYEVASLLLIAAAIFIVLSLISVHLSVSAEPVRLSGEFGHKLGSILFATLGWGSVACVISLLLFALYLPSSEPLREKGVELHWSWGAGVGILMAIFSVSALLSVFLTVTSGGKWGAEVSFFLINFFGQGGAGILLGLVFVFSLSLILGKSTLAVLMLAFSGLWTLCKASFSLLVMAYDFLVQSIAFVIDKLCTLFSFFVGAISSSRDDNFEVSQAPAAVNLRTKKNRARAVKKLEESEDEEDESLEEVDEDEEDYTHVVVNRRGATTEKKSRASKPLKPKRVEYSDYHFPSIELLTPGDGTFGAEDDETLKRKSRLIEEKLKDFGVLGKVTLVHPGPVITLFEFEPAAGVKVGRVVALQDDLAMSLKASAVRIIAPIPGKGSVGIEVPNPQRDIVRLRDVIESPAFTGSESSLSVPIGKNIYGDPVVVDIAQMPHLLMAGSTGTGKSVSINSLLIGMLFKASPADLGLILIDPKVLELSVYDGIPHLRVPVVTVPKQAKAVLNWAVHEMDRRYHLMQKFGVRGIDAYNRLVKGENAKQAVVQEEDVIPLTEEQIIQEGVELDDAQAESAETRSGVSPEELQPLSKIVIVIDELADLMLTVGKEIEELITRLAQKARAAGIHLIVATQRPSVDVITGLIKANFPARLSFRVSSRIDSRTILDSMGAERLLGKGDMLLMLPGSNVLERCHGAYLSDQEVAAVVDSIKQNSTPQYDPEIIEACERALKEEESPRSGELDSNGVEYDDLYDQAVELVMQKGQASTSMLQRAFRIGYNRAARIVDTLEREGIIGPMDGAKPREVLVQSASTDDF